MKNENRPVRIGVFFLAFLFMLNLTARPALAAPDWPADTGIQAEAGIVVDATSGAVLFGQNIHVAYAPASITKLLTALVVAEHASPDETVTFSHDAVYNVESGSGNSLALEEGDVLTVRDCMHALLLRSSNQAANALAEHVAGSRDGFVTMMNEKIAEIGCTESHFANPSGLNDEQQYVTAYDMALIARAAFANETVLAAASTQRYQLPATIKNPNGLTITMEHKILAARDNPSSQFYLEGVVAGKTGYTSKAGNTLVTYAVRDGRGLISVILKGTQPQYYLDGKTLIEFGFASFTDISVAEQENYLAKLDGIDFDGYHYAPSELYLEEAACVTVPNAASFADVTRTYTQELGYGHPQTAVARLLYTYHDRQVGSAYICVKSLHIPIETIAVSIVETEEVTGKETGEETGEETAGEPVETARDPRTPLVIGALILLTAVAGVGFFLWFRHRKAAAEAARRHARRMERIRELGYSEEEFREMVRQRRTGGGRNSR